MPGYIGINKFYIYSDCLDYILYLLSFNKVLMQNEQIKNEIASSRNFVATLAEHK